MSIVAAGGRDNFFLSTVEILDIDSNVWRQGPAILMEEWFWLEGDHHQMTTLTLSFDFHIEFKMMCGKRWSKP
jgi:hypothetical protein